MLTYKISLLGLQQEWHITTAAAQARTRKVIKCPYFNCTPTSLKSWSPAFFLWPSPEAAVNSVSSPCSKKQKGWWKGTKLPLSSHWVWMLLSTSQGGMGDKRVLSSSPESVTPEGRKEKSLSTTHTTASTVGWTIPMTDPGSPARDGTLIHPQPLKSSSQLDCRIQVAHFCITPFCTYKTVQTWLNKNCQDYDSEFQDTTSVARVEFLSLPQ